MRIPSVYTKTLSIEVNFHQIIMFVLYLLFSNSKQRKIFLVYFLKCSNYLSQTNQYTKDSFGLLQIRKILDFIKNKVIK